MCVWVSVSPVGRICPLTFEGYLILDYYFTATKLTEKWEVKNDHSTQKKLLWAGSKVSNDLS